MSDPDWYRSLYWRIALGFVLCLTGLLVAQALLFLWLAERAGVSMIARSPQRLAAVVASDISDALEADEHADIQRTLIEQLQQFEQSATRADRIIVLMRDGRIFQNDPSTPPPDWALRAARFRLLYHRFPDQPPPNATDANPNDRPNPNSASNPGPDDRTSGPPPTNPSEGLDRGGSERRLSEPPRRLLPIAPIQVRGETTGVVLIVPARREPYPFLREFGPTLAGAGIVLLLVGTGTMAFFVFRPARRRLRKLESAAEAIGAGDTTVRAPEDGGDEVAELAKVFNRMAADLDARVRQLEEVDRARRQLLADVSHELMTPLTAIRGYLETLALPAAVHDPEARDRYLHIVTEETLRLEAIIGDLLDLARLEGGGAALQRDAVPVKLLFDRAAERHGPTLQDRRVTLQTTIAPGAEYVEGDARRLEQALQNLVANAVRHVPPEGTITLTATPELPRVRLRVEDNGPGIPPEHLPKIFDRFYRVDAARDHASGGSGLGLSIVRAIIEAHGGTVTATAAPTGGARFDILLNKPQR